MPPTLTSIQRTIDLNELATNPVDVLVIGGGAIGVGAALDAVTRGLSVALVERGDLASGASAHSSRIIHGGTRYLTSVNLARALESAAERDYLLRRIAPHLVHSAPVILPEYDGAPARARRLTRAGLRVGNVVRMGAGTAKAVLPPPRKIAAAEAEALVPAIRRPGLLSAMLSFDAQIEDDARLVIALARTATTHGARIIPRVSALSVNGDGAVLRDELTGSTLRTEARAVINATGAWVGELAPEISVGYRRGTHLLVRSDRLGSPRCALAIRRGDALTDLVLIAPQPDGLTLIGPSDVPASSADDDQAHDDEVAALLELVNTVVRDPLTTDEVVGVFAATRPVLLEDKAQDLSSAYELVVSDDGVVHVLGGNLTTYRRIAEAAVDRATSVAMMWAAECQTRMLPLVGAASAPKLAAVDAPQRLINRYGIEAAAVAALGDERRVMREKVVPGLPYTRAELVWGLRHEMAMTPEDLIDRRTRIGLTQHREAGLEVASRVMDIVAGV